MAVSNKHDMWIWFHANEMECQVKDLLQNVAKPGHSSVARLKLLNISDYL